MFGKKKKCPRCGNPVKDEWSFCPRCGADLREEEFGFRFPSWDSIFEDIEKHFKEIDRMFSSEFFEFPKVRFREKERGKVRSGGISIVIRSGTGMKPQISIRTTGDYKKLEPKIKKMLGVSKGVEEVEETKPIKIKEEKEEKPLPKPKVAEEPETRVKHLGAKQIIEIELPDVKSEKDIEVKKLEQSIEIKAFAKDKVYFKLLPIRPNAQIIDQEFKDGILRIELSS